MGRQKEKKRKEKKRKEKNDDYDVAIGIASFPSWSKSMCNPETCIM
jgi:hypothetical protein